MNTYKAIVNNHEYTISVSELAELSESEENNQFEDFSQYYCDIVKHILLCIFTLGIWGMIWIYRTTEFLNNAPDSEYYNPATKLLLSIFVPFYNIFWIYNHAKRIDRLSEKYNLRSDISTICLVCAIFIPIASHIIMQDKINDICRVNAKK